MKKSQLAMTVGRRVGVPRLLDLYWGADRVTVLAHHRVTDEGALASFPYFQPNISATPAMFEAQLAYVVAHFNVISVADLAAYVVEGKPLPPRPLLITFDDGFLDNYEYAYPALKKLGLPAVIFLMTSRMDNPVPAWWDECAYYFFHTEQMQAELPLIGQQTFDSVAGRMTVRDQLTEALKRVPEAEKLSALAATGEVLGVAPPPADPGLFVNWDQVREMVNNGVACMPHTVNHPILTRVSPDEQQAEVIGSRDRIRDETRQQTVAFAYPNGGVADYNATTVRILQEAGFSVAFTLVPGPMRPASLRRHPFEIQRVFLSHRDSLDRFVFKTMGVPALQEPARFIAS